MPHQIFIVEDHPVVREGYISLIQRESDLHVCGWAEDGLEGLDGILEAKPDIALLDISVPGLNGLELIKRIKAMEPGIQILVVSAHDEMLYAERAIRGGAQGYLMKHQAGEVIIDAIRGVLSGNLFVSQRLRKTLLGRYFGKENKETSPFDQLSDRELEVFQLLGRGFSIQEIAEAMHISPKTVVTYRSHIKEKLGLENSAELTRQAVLWVESLIG